MKLNTFTCATVLAMTTVMVTQSARAAIALDRTRVIFDGRKTSLALGVSNQSKSLPYLAQAWVEDTQGKKIESPLTALPPLQRVEPGAKTQVKLQMTGGGTPLPVDRETLFYFNLREIPPKSSTPNVLQIALQTRVKLFYRPAALAMDDGDTRIPQKQLTLTREGDRYRVNNPTGYYMTLIGASASEKEKTLPDFKAQMVPPKDSQVLNAGVAALGSHPVLTYINDYGGRPQVIFSCSGNTCTVTGTKSG